MRLAIRPITVKAAQKLIKRWHRHLSKVQGGMFAASVYEDGELVGVGIVGNPAQEWQGTGRCVITRIAVPGHDDRDAGGKHKNACSMLYGALCRAAEALGYGEVWTYTLPDEPGISLRGAGFTEVGMSDGGEHDRPSRKRAPAVRPDPKKRWVRKLRNGLLEREISPRATAQASLPL